MNKDRNKRDWSGNGELRNCWKYGENSKTWGNLNVCNVDSAQEKEVICVSGNQMCKEQIGSNHI